LRGALFDKDADALFVVLGSRANGRSRSGIFEEGEAIPLPPHYSQRANGCQ
jgi:hypothetical protein